MTDLITEARELCEKATPGPWTWRDVTDDSKYFLSAKDLVSEDSLIISAEDIYPGYPECGQDLVLNLSTDDAAFIARSRTLIPELCDALEKAERESGCEWCADNYDQRYKTMFRKGSDWDYEAKYCDMCGKRLEEHHEAD